MHNFTSNDLLLYIFNETTDQTSLEIEKAIESHAQLREEYLNLQQTLAEVEQFSLSPNDRIVENVLSQFREKEIA